jgi:(1->4)-alpha-D-glucan 1-alpha-D-glucosylmutase
MARKMQTHYQRTIIMVIPSCTYRIQFNPRFTFNHLAELTSYLDDLGVTSIYASPILQPSKGSEHGYDGIDPSRLNPELGTFEELEKLSGCLRDRGIGWIQDIVPNHLAFHTNNIWLRDVLERGINSSFSFYFDIDWEHPAYPNKLMVPFLDSTVTDCIAQDKLKLAFDTGSGFYLSYYDSQYPVSLETYPTLLSGCFSDEHNAVNSAISALVNNLNTGYEHWSSLKNDLLQLLAQENIPSRIEEKLKQINEDKPALLNIISVQYYVLCLFTVSHTQINYRRFFNVNGLICLRIEDEIVFNDYHRFIHTLYKKGIIQGLRVDHIDGLKNPHEYIRRLRSLFGNDCYIIVEKILDIKEELPATWEIQGTSGYEFLSYINQVITDRKGSEKLLAIYHEYVPQYSDYEDIVFKNKFANLETYLNGEWDNLLRLLLSLNLVDDGEIRLPDLKMALGVFMAAFPVYRVYIEGLPLEINDEQLVVAAFVKAFKRYPELSYQLGVLRELFVPHPDKTKNRNRLLFIQRLMQFTGPLAAKGIEDTTFYLYNPLISHNEVGDQPCVLGIPVREFHEKMQQRFLRNNLSLNCTSTHDTKRGEDNRIRINIISEVTEEWATLVAHWQKINEPFRKTVDAIRAPIVNDEYFLYQAIIGGFPEDLKVNEDFISRTKKYFTKVLRESKLMSDHVKPNLPYEEACSAFIEHLLNADHSFLPSLLPFVKKIRGYANTYTMIQVIIKMTAPGIPDVYQGCELWDLSYVDPDNRRPVDFELRKKLLEQLKEKEPNANSVLQWAKENYETGAQKLLVTWRMMQFRKSNNRLFIEGEYIPVYTEGSDRVVIAYFRRFETDWILVVLPLGIVANTGKELDVVLPTEAPRNWKNIFTQENISGNTIDVHQLFWNFPVAVLTATN